MDTNPQLDRELESAQAALLARYAPDTRARRARWSQGETHVLDLGVGPPLLLLHGAMDNAFLWAPILSALARNRRVLAVDFPGHGLADAFDTTLIASSTRPDGFLPSSSGGMTPRARTAT